MFIFLLYLPAVNSAGGIHAQCGQSFTFFFFLRPMQQNCWFIDSKRSEVCSLPISVLVKSTMDFINFIVSLFIASWSQEQHRRFQHLFPSCCHPTVLSFHVARDWEVCKGSVTAQAHWLQNNCTEHRPDVLYKVKYHFLVSDILYLEPKFFKALQACLWIILILVPTMLL